MSRFGVREDKEKALLDRMKALGIQDKDLEEKFIRSGGPGGQNINKTSTCVYLKHIPSGIEVKVQKDRSQAVNRFLARRLLADRYEKEVLEKPTDHDKEIKKIKKQKARRKRRARKNRDHGGPESTHYFF